MPLTLVEQTIYDIILANTVPIDRTYPRSGATIHRVTPAIATALIPAILSAKRTHLVPLAYFLAVMCQESRFDPYAENPNLNRFPVRSLATTDVGLAQVSGKNLIALFPSHSDSQRYAIAKDPVWATDYMAKTYRRLLTWAKTTEFREEDGSGIGTPVSVDPLQLATMAYNKGMTGARLIVEKRTNVKLEAYATSEKLAVMTQAGWKHVWNVMEHYRRFLPQLGSA